MKPLDESIENGCRQYCGQVAGMIEGDIEDWQRQKIEELMHAAYLSGASQLAAWQAKHDGDPDVSPSKCVEAIERAAKRVIGTGSEPPRKTT